jgi:DNA-binding response OmpR family regulator
LPFPGLPLHASNVEGAVKIILVEDEALIALFVQEALEEEGFAVEFLNDAYKAEAAINPGIEEVSALVTDVRLGAELTGWELARLAREASPNLPVVYISGDSAVEHSAQGVPDSLMIQKPFVGAQVVTALATLLNAKPPEDR